MLITITAHAFISYSLCAAMQRHYSEAVMPVLGLQHAAQDATRAQRGGWRCRQRRCKGQQSAVATQRHHKDD
jgi:hypothetical protein